MSRTFRQRADLLRRGKRPEHTMEQTAKRSANRRVGVANDELWQMAYEAKLLELQLDEKYRIYKDAADSIRLNRSKGVHGLT